MRLSEDVKPVDELMTSGAQLVRNVAENRRTVLLTDNGTAKAVLMDVASYDRWRDTVAPNLPRRPRGRDSRQHISQGGSVTAVSGDELPS